MCGKTNGKTYLPNSASCFVCGEENRAGLQTRFYVENGLVKTRFRPQPHHCGYRNVVHGGVVAAILDECMGWAAARAIGRMCFTAELTVRYLSPVPADQETIVETELIRASKRMASAAGRVVTLDGVELARAEGRFLPLTPEQTLEVDDYLIYRGGEERVFDYLRGNTPADGAG